MACEPCWLVCRPRLPNSAIPRASPARRRRGVPGYWRRHVPNGKGVAVVGGGNTAVEEALAMWGVSQMRGWAQKGWPSTGGSGSQLVVAIKRDQDTISTIQRSARHQALVPPRHSLCRPFPQ